VFLQLTAILRPVNIGISRVGYLNQTSFSSILTPPSALMMSAADLPSAVSSVLKLRILFAAAEACATSVTC
jgi:hypothetical protein